MSTPAAIFTAVDFDGSQKLRLDEDGHVVLPALLTPETCARLTTSLSYIQSLMPGDEDHRPSHYSAEYDDYLASLIDHPQMLDLARRILGPEIRFDHCRAWFRPHLLLCEWFRTRRRQSEGHSRQPPAPRSKSPGGVG
ncbi:MAG TPA: hypothetical protein EYQ31_17190 [Candidatus Handelsmanbacteria bacterium]|nr:hypothetical protein [Candidatus Handelsmanbacteria bacterium]